MWYYIAAIFTVDRRIAFQWRIVIVKICFRKRKICFLSLLWRFARRNKKRIQQNAVSCVVFALPRRACKLFWPSESGTESFFCSVTVISESGIFRLYVNISCEMLSALTAPRGSHIKEERRKMLYIKPPAVMHYSQRHEKSTPWESPTAVHLRIIICNNSWERQVL